MKKIFSFCCCFFLLSLQTSLLTAQQSQDAFYLLDTAKSRKLAATRDMVEKMYKEFAQRHKLPGMVYGLVADGKMIYWGSTGVQNLEQNDPVTEKSVFRIASMTKSFTALAILILKDEGRLQLDDPAYKYIPELKNIKTLTPDAPEITIRHLLTHMSGLPEDNPWGDHQLAATESFLTALIKTNPSFSNPPGVEYEYSNTGYALLGRIITNVSGQPYQKYIQQKIFDKLGMKNTYWEPTIVPARVLASGYRLQGGKYLKEPLPGDGSFGAMGGLLSNLEDYSKYVMLHSSAWPASGEQTNSIIKNSSLREMHVPYTFNNLNAGYTFLSGANCPLFSAYSFGLRWAADCKNNIYIGHSGGLPGYGSNWVFLPQYGIGMVAFANLTYAPLSSFHYSVMDSILKISKLDKFVPLTSAILDQRKKELLNYLPHWKNAENSPTFADNFFPDLPVEERIKQSRQVFDNLGKILGVGEMKALNQLRGSFVIRGEKSNAEVFITLSPENPARIQFLRITEIKHH
jgi:CubicO group peptidase (beta-lactamase class C family)